MNTKTYPGQIGLILLVILGLLITLVMSLASRTLSDSVLSRQDKEQSATFAIAESGVEEALKSIREGSLPTGSSPVVDSLSQIVGQYSVSSRDSLEIFLREGETAEINLVGTVTPNLTISWTRNNTASETPSCGSEGSGNTPAAIELATINKTTSLVGRAYFNPSNCAIAGNGFAVADVGSNGYLSQTILPIAAGTTSVRIRTIYNGATVVVTGTSLPPQQYDIQSQARGGDAQKEIEVKRTIDNPPGIFDFALFSGGEVIK